MVRALLTNRWALLILTFLLHLYVFQALKLIVKNLNISIRLTIFVLYWALFVGQVYCIFNFSVAVERTSYFLFTFFVIVFVAQLFASVFLLVDDLRRFFVLAKNAFTHKRNPENGISRSSFLSWLAILVGGFMGGTFLYGVTNRYNYKLRTVKMNFPNLPKAFKGLKIVQLSDIHSGSFNNPTAVMRGVQMALDAKPDLILFTGDLVNNRATEMHDYKAIFSKLKAPMGVYSTLGNHDYGDYVKWETPQAKIENLNNLKKLQAEMGWRLLMNENVIFERDGEKIALLGIENWGAKGHFPKYGRLDLAHKGTEDIPFKILMSHDPSHWDAQVRPLYPDIDLTLSGHTHGMQFGIEVPGFKWSPIKWMYEEWEDLYQKKKQYIYVNRGFGFLVYMGRVGILPEVTLIELV
ncbi:MAG: metallophosphatase [Pseudopedobacter saltans]|uniref:Metallophosphatase n=1 Tax=Pseudopedobacter saltans TaxID=151895 RepID=A0A2W5F540_9SPHI|nr:MAG: metallophosphatase [Pseudopedobacter saltans]